MIIDLSKKTNREVAEFLLNLSQELEGHDPSGSFHSAALADIYLKLDSISEETCRKKGRIERAWQWLTHTHT